MERVKEGEGERGRERGRDGKSEGGERRKRGEGEVESLMEL